MNHWFTSDLHFGHSKVIEYCNRPWLAEEQTEALIARWNSRVQAGDIVYHHGDFAFYGRGKRKLVVDIIQQLNGQIFFIRGNHCNADVWSHVEQARLSNVVKICDYHEAKIQGQKIVMCHYPFEVWNGSHHGSWHTHGHTHGSLAPLGKRLDVGIDNHPDSQVFSFEEVAEHMAKQEIYTPSHHKG